MNESGAVKDEPCWVPELGMWSTGGYVGKIREKSEMPWNAICLHSGVCKNGKKMANTKNENQNATLN